MIKKILILIIIIILLGFGWQKLTKEPTGLSKNIIWGVAFSKPFALQMGLNWQELYLAMIDDLKVKNLRLPIYWPEVEPSEGIYNFAEYDWMIKEAEKRNIELILVIGRKLPRWPECHIPSWASSRDEVFQQEKVMFLLSEIVKRYKNSSSLFSWQVENEPFLPFGECPDLDKNFLDREISLVKSLDPLHPIVVTDSGELSIWLRAAKRADIFGTTMYRIIYHKTFGYIKYPLPPKFFWLKANLVHLLYPGKPIIVSELQAEPWGPKLIYELSLDEQERSMDLKKFNETMDYARAVGFPRSYLWGTEWWYWMKTQHNQPAFWEVAKKIINE